MKIVIVGPGYPLRGGIATFNHRLARAFIEQGHECEIVSFSLQYPSFLFPGKTQFSTEQQSDNIKIRRLINSVNPFSWFSTGNTLKKEKPDLIVVRYWLPFMGPALGTLLRRVRKNKYTKIICLCDNAVPHEKRPGDNLFTKYFVKACDAFVAMSEKVKNDLMSFDKTKPKLLIYHPVYDNFGEAIDAVKARKHLGFPENEDLFLFFGFIRKYKGLDILIEALSIYKKAAEKPFKLIIAGEFYEDEQPYIKLIDNLDLKNDIILFNEFIPDSEVKYFLCAGDLLIQPYRNATQSGVTPLAYHFETPMIVTKVGGLEKQVPDQKAGYVVEPTAEAIADAMKKFSQKGKAAFIPFLQQEKQNYSWEHMVSSMIELTQTQR